MAATQERTFLLIKPDGVQRGLVGKIIQRFEAKGFKLIAMNVVWASEDLVKKHYAELACYPFFPISVRHMTSGPVVPMVWEGQDVVKTGRKMLGTTNPVDSAQGTIRGDFCVQTWRNMFHGADSVEAAKEEIALWFKPEELIDWQPICIPWVYEK